MIFLIRIYCYFLGTFLVEIMETKLGVCLIYLLPQPGHQEALPLLSPGCQWSLHHSLQTYVKIWEYHRPPRLLQRLEILISYAAALLTSSPHQCRSPLCYWLQWSCLMCCCHPAGSLPPPSDSPNHHQTVPEQKVMTQSHKFKHQSVESANICFFPVNQYETDIPGEHTRPLYRQ